MLPWQALGIANCEPERIAKAKPENEFDVVIVDSTDYGVAVPLFTKAILYASTGTFE